MADEPGATGERGGGRKVALVAGLGLIGLGAYQLTKKPPARAPTPTPTPLPTPTPAPPGVYNWPPWAMVQGQSISVRSGPGVNFAQVGSLTYGRYVYVLCQTRGGVINGSSVWDRIAGGPGAPQGGYVADALVSTPAFNQYSPGTSVCTGVPVSPTPAPAPPSALPTTGQPTGLAPINDVRAVLPGWIISTSCALGVADYLVVMAGGPPFGFGQPTKQKRWIADGFTWSKLGVGRSAIRLVTPDVVNALPSGPDLRWGGARGQGVIWVNGAPQQWPTGNPGGYCT